MTIITRRPVTQLRGNHGHLKMTMRYRETDKRLHWLHQRDLLFSVFPGRGTVTSEPLLRIGLVTSDLAWSSRWLRTQPWDWSKPPRMGKGTPILQGWLWNRECSRGEWHHKPFCHWQACDKDWLQETECLDCQSSRWKEYRLSQSSNNECGNGR